MGKNDDVEIETQEEWEELLAREGLVVIDVYQGAFVSNPAICNTRHFLLLQLLISTRMV